MPLKHSLDSLFKPASVAVVGATNHPYFVGLSAFVAAGLVFAGVTDICGIGLLLARMPWNRVTLAGKESP